MDTGRKKASKRRQQQHQQQQQQQQSKEYPMFLNLQYPVPQERVEYNYSEYYNVLQENHQPLFPADEIQFPMSARRSFTTYPLPGMPPLELYQPLPPPPLQLHSQQQPPLYGRGSVSAPKSKPTVSKRLIRTSSLPNSESGSSEKQYETRRVSVELDGDLETMTMNWTDEEMENKRRLVMFKWHHTRTKIRLSFQPVSQEQYHPDMTVVSCIYDEKDKFLFTSVDFINFFESLANSKFKIEEKNRIRRNLQSLKPLTITKQYNKDLFSLIMEFGTPKPRNIEKNVKVFHWDRFQQLLAKIASKYSIDYQGQEVLQLPNSLPQHQLSSVTGTPSYQGEMLQPIHPVPFTFYHPQQQQQQQQQMPGFVEQVDQLLPMEQGGGIYPDDQLSRSFYAYLPNFPY